ncbi:MAG: ankyrin repeat domain-containing protein [Candidatus Micrarchaeota archaeon]|nr:ankyrin repeat domain-containing protein [Candidatus Micrarchaeota archaeon]
MGQLEKDLFQAAEAGNTSRVKELIEKGADVNAKSRGMPIPLRWRTSGHGGNSVDDGYERDKTALYLAVLNGHAQTVKLLLDNGADMNTELVHGGGTTLHLAAEKGHTQMDKGADVNAKDNYGATPLKWAASNALSRVTETAKLLLERGAEVNDEVLSSAAFNAHTEIVKLLLDKEAGLNATGKDCDAALLSATSNAFDNEKMVALLLKRGADVNTKGKYDDTSLHEAALEGHTKTVKLLLDKGADPNAKNKYGKNPIDLAESRNHTEIVKLLKEKRASLANETPKDKRDYRNAVRAMTPEPGTEKLSRPRAKGPQKRTH